MKITGAKKDEYGNYFIEREKGKLLISLRGSFLFCNFFGEELWAKAKFGHWKQNLLLTGTKQEKQEQIDRHLKRLLA